MIYANGSKYNGEWKDNKRNGKGIYTRADGIGYQVVYKDDKLTKKGPTYYFPNGDKYTGDIYVEKDNKDKKDDKAAAKDPDTEPIIKDGKGTLLLANGDKYEGAWKSDKQDGKGKFTNANGDVYDGEWKKGIKTGKGKMTLKDKTVYDGEWKNDKPDGEGTYTWPDGTKYSGDFKDGLADGKGKMTWKNGDKYNGQWKQDKPDGQGTYCGKDKQYKGEWSAGNTVSKFYDDNHVKTYLQ